MSSNILNISAYKAIDKCIREIMRMMRTWVCTSEIIMNGMSMIVQNCIGVIGWKLHGCDGWKMYICDGWELYNYKWRIDIIKLSQIYIKLSLLSFRFRFLFKHFQS